MPSAPDWRKGHEFAYRMALQQELAMGWPYEVASERARERARASSERSINAYQQTQKMVKEANPLWSDEEVAKETARLEKMKATYNEKNYAGGGFGQIKHIAWKVGGKTVVKV